MGQQEVYNYLKNNKGKWLTSKEIAQGLRVSLGSVTNNLKKLRKTERDNLKFKLDGNRYYYKFK